MALCHIDDQIDKSDVVMQELAADTVMKFLPGIVSGLQEVAMESEIQNHKVTMVKHDSYTSDCFSRNKLCISDKFNLYINWILI